jgi:hypothetical protein
MWFINPPMRTTTRQTRMPLGSIKKMQLGFLRREVASFCRETRKLLMCCDLYIIAASG